jgi:hypothetical protein
MKLDDIIDRMGNLPSSDASKIIQDELDGSTTRLGRIAFRQHFGRRVANLLEDEGLLIVTTFRTPSDRDLRMMRQRCRTLLLKVAQGDRIENTDIERLATDLTEVVDELQRERQRLRTLAITDSREFEQLRDRIAELEKT